MKFFVKQDRICLASVVPVVLGFPAYYLKSAKYIGLDIIEQIKDTRGSIFFRGAIFSMPLLSAM